MPLFWPLSLILRIGRLPGEPTVSCSANIVHRYRDCIQLAACTVRLFGGINITNNNLLQSGSSGHTIDLNVENEGAEDMSIRLLVYCVVEELPGEPTVSCSANIVHRYRDCIQLAACTVRLFGGINITNNNLLQSGSSGHTIDLNVENEGAEDMSIRLLVYCVVEDVIE